MEASLLDNVVPTVEKPSCVVGSIDVDQIVKVVAVCSTVENVMDCEEVVDKESLGISVVIEATEAGNIVDGTKVEADGIAEDAVVCISETLAVVGISVVGSCVVNDSEVVCEDNSVVCATVVVFHVEEVKVVWGPSVVGIAEDVVTETGNCTKVVVGGTCVVDTVASLLVSEFVAANSSAIVGDVISEGFSVAANVEDVVEVASLVVSTVEEPSSPGGFIDVDETVVCSTGEDVVDCGKVDTGSLVCWDVRTIGISVEVTEAEKIVDGTEMDGDGNAEDAVTVVVAGISVV